MKQYGITREVDNLGRVVIPKSIRTELKLEAGEKLCVYREGNKIIIEKYGELSGGITRDLDSLGRVVVPKTMRCELGIDTGDKISVYREGDRIIVEKYNPFCTFCGGEENTVVFCNKIICAECVEKIKEM